MSKYFRIPLLSLGVPSLPAPKSIAELVDSFTKLSSRASQTIPAKNALSVSYTINGKTAPAHYFLYGDPNTKSQEKINHFEDVKSSLSAQKDVKSWVDNSLKNQNDSQDRAIKTAAWAVFLEKPEQFSLSWTTLDNFHAQGTKVFLDRWAKTLTDPQVANEVFWEMISQYGLAYNLLIIKKVNEQSVIFLRKLFGQNWSTDIENLYKNKQLYYIDLGIFGTTDTVNVDGFLRWTPATVTLLEQNPQNKKLSPIAVHVSNKNKQFQIYVYKKCTTSAWLYALQAAKVSITVFGVWLGHVFPWHIVTGALQMCMHNNLDNNHPLYALLAPQSKYLIPFDLILLLLWKKIAPPTAIDSGVRFVELIREYNKNRQFFDDDPAVRLARFGIKKEDFTVNKDWDAFPIVADMLEVWNMTAKYVNTVVDSLYKDDQQVSNDQQLQEWVVDAGKEFQILSILNMSDAGNVQGLPVMNSKKNLKDLITSFLYRINMHGAARLPEVANPYLSFVANFPPCLQDDKMPAPNASFDTKKLLSYLPNTQVIGDMLDFYYTFAFSAPYVPTLPLNGNTADLYWSNPQDPKNQALIGFRNELETFIRKYVARSNQGGFTHQAQIHQWDLNIET